MPKLHQIHFRRWLFSYLFASRSLRGFGTLQVSLCCSMQNSRNYNRAWSSVAQVFPGDVKGEQGARRNRGIYYSNRSFERFSSRRSGAAGCWQRTWMCMSIVPWFRLPPSCPKLLSYSNFILAVLRLNTRRAMLWNCVIFLKILMWTRLIENITKQNTPVLK